MNKALLAVFLGLAGSSPAMGADASSAAYYFGKSETFAPDGTLAGSSWALIRREVYPDQNLIIERLAVMNSSSAVTSRDFTTVASVSGSTSKFVELNGAFRGTGELEGPSGRWTAWSSRSVMPNGGVLESHDRLSGRTLIVEKKYFDAGGKLGAVIKELFPAISESEYKERYGKLSPNR